MRRLSTIILLFFVLASQAQDEKKGLKNYYKGKYEAAEEEFSKIVRMFRFSSLGHFGMALLYANPTYPKADMYKAYEMMRVAVKKKKTIRPKKLEDVKKYFALDSIDALDKRIHQALYDSVMAKDSWAYTKNYLEKCTESPFYSDVQKLAIDQQYRAVKDTNTVASYTWFVRQYPKEKQAEEAIEIRNDLAYTATKSENTLEAYQAFLDNYPEAKQFSEAEKTRNSLAFDQAKKTNTIAAFKVFVEEYETAEQVATAKNAILNLAFQAAEKTNTDKAWAAFLKEYGESSKAKEAQQAREKLAYENAVKINTTEAYDYFMRKYPESNRLPSAFDKKTALISANFKFDLQEGNPPTSIKVYDCMNSNGKAVAHIKVVDGYLLLGKVRNNKRWKNDAWVMLLKTDGSLLWEKKFGGAYDDVLSHALETADGYVLAGHTKGRSSTDRETWVIKLSKKGELLWEKTEEGIGVQGIVQKNGTIILASTTLDDDKMHQIKLIQLTQSGDVRNTQVHPGLGFPKAIVRGATGQVFVATKNKLLQIDDQLAIAQQIQVTKGKSIFNLKSSASGMYVIGRHYDYKKANKSDFYLAKYDGAGKLQWEKTYDNNSQQDIAYDLAENADGSLVLVGLSEKENVDNLQIIQLSADGVQQSTQTLGTTASEKKPTIQVGESLTVLLSSGVDSDLIFIQF